MRSGTHLLIDTILNNFTRYKNRPLYIDLDQYALKKKDPLLLRHINGAIIKTHYPQIDIPDFDVYLRSITSKGNYIVLTPIRNLDDVTVSLKKFGNKSKHTGISEQQYTIFKDYWIKYNPKNILFSDLVSRDSYKSCIKSISIYIDEPSNKEIIYPPCKNTKRFYVYFWKFLTRSIGRYSPIVNTTISFKK